MLNSLLFFCASCLSLVPFATSIEAKKNISPTGEITSITFIHSENTSLIGIHLTCEDTPILGDWILQSGKTEFIPALPLESTLNYFATYRSQGITGCYEIKGSRASHVTPPAVVNIYPTANELPENLLRFYVEFSKPMREDNYINHIRFLDEEGNELKGVFLPSRHEYWNKERTKITILFDPGRVKTGLAAHEQYGGRVLKPGKKYTLIIKSTWVALDGSVLQKETTKSFSVTREVIRTILPEDWDITTPSVHSREPLSIRFSLPVDHINAQTYLHVKDENNDLVEGTISLSNSEKNWQFKPAKPWLEGNYRLIVNKKLEDVCGNNLIHGFDVYKASEIAKKNDKNHSEISFRIQ